MFTKKHNETLDLIIISAGNFHHLSIRTPQRMDGFIRNSLWINQHVSPGRTKTFDLLDTLSSRYLFTDYMVFILSFYIHTGLPCSNRILYPFVMFPVRSGWLTDITAEYGMTCSVCAWAERFLTAEWIPSYSKFRWVPCEMQTAAVREGLAPCPFNRMFTAL